MDPGVRSEAGNLLAGLFRGIGERSRSGGESDGGLGDLGLGGMAEDIQEFVAMPMDLAVLFLEMGTDLAEMVLKALEEAGFILVKGLTPL